MHLSPPLTRQPLLATLQQQRLRVCLADFPGLALAATATRAELDTDGDTFAGVLACLETLNRLQLSASSCRLLMLLARHGPAPCKHLAGRMGISHAAITGLITRLEALELITLTRGGQADRREVILTLTDAARKVLASIVALTALGQAGNCLRQK